MALHLVSHGFDIDSNATAVYGYALHNGAVDPAPGVADELGMTVETLVETIDRLVGIHLLRADLTGRNRFTAADPDIAAAALISPLEGEIHNRRREISTIRAQIGGLGAHYEQARPRQEPAAAMIRSLRCRTEVTGSLYLAANRCRDEMISVRPRGAAWADCTLDETLAQDVAMLANGVRIRVVYPHSARTDFTSKAYLKRIIAEGADVRTTNHLPKQFAVYDRELAFTPDSRNAVEVSNAAVAQLLCEVFEYIWDSAQPYSTAASGYQGVAEEILRDIAKLLAEGLTDEAIARRLGISLRACRRHVARLMRDLDAVSRFQAGMRAASAGFVSA